MLKNILTKTAWWFTKRWLFGQIDNYLNAWVKVHKGQWDHEDWELLIKYITRYHYAKLAENKSMQDYIGLLLEIKRTEYAKAAYDKVRKQLFNHI